MPPRPFAVGPSRRALIGAASAVPILAPSAPALATVNPTLALCRDWLADEAEIERLLPLWSDLDERGLPCDAVDARLTTLNRRRNAGLDRLPALVAEDPPTFAAKLAVAARLIVPEDHPVAHRLLTALLEDVARLRCPHCRLRPDA